MHWFLSDSWSAAAASFCPGLFKTPIWAYSRTTPSPLRSGKCLSPQCCISCSCSIWAAGRRRTPRGFYTGCYSHCGVECAGPWGASRRSDSCSGPGPCGRPASERALTARGSLLCRSPSWIVRAAPWVRSKKKTTCKTPNRNKVLSKVIYSLPYTNIIEGN